MGGLKITNPKVSISNIFFKYLTSFGKKKEFTKIYINK